MMIKTSGVTATAPAFGLRGHPRTWLLAAMVALLAVCGVMPVAAHAAPEGTLELLGEPLRHTFDSTTAGDSVQGSWSIVNRGGDDVVLDGVLAPVGVVDDSLAKALVVEYGEVSPAGVVVWHGAGTLGRPERLRTAVESIGQLRAGASLEVPVKVSLPDPSRLSGRPGQQLMVEANFTVSYMRTGDTDSPVPEDGTGDGSEADIGGGGGDVNTGEVGSNPGPGSGGTPVDTVAGNGTVVDGGQSNDFEPDRGHGPLATTGVSGLLWIALAAAALIWLGLYLRRRSTRRDHDVAA